jgi:hypothetical protein
VVEAVKKRSSSSRLACRDYGGKASIVLIGNLPSNDGDVLSSRSIWQQKRAG